MSSSREAIAAAYENLDAAFGVVTALSYDALTATETKNLLVRLEAHRRRQPAAEHPLINQLATECTPETLGGTSLADVLATAMRISKEEAKRRITEADELGPRTAMSGDLLDPRPPTTASAQAEGKIGAEHLKVIHKFFEELPSAIDLETRQQAEIQLATLAAGLGPVELRAAAGRLAQTHDQDGAPPTDADRARRRWITVGKQGADGMSELRGLLDPEARAVWDAVQSKWAAPGMCNADDDVPTVDGQPPESASQGDLRSQPQRNHDAFDNTDADVDEQDAPDATQADDDPATDYGNPNHEAARYRVERNDARRGRDQMQQERDEAHEQLTRMRQSVVDQIASAAGLSDSGLLAYEGHDLDSLLTDFGAVDADKVRRLVAEVMRKHGIIRRMGLSPNPQQASGSGAPPRGSTSEQWARSFGPSR